MKVNIFGLGYVGCVSSVCFANSGHRVLGIDIDKTKVDKINQGKSPIVEPGLEDALQTALSSDRLRATTDDLEPADISIVCVGTPSDENGGLRLDYIKRVAEQIGESLRDLDSYHVVNIRSTVLPGTVESELIPRMERCSGKKAGEDFGVCMNPEFLREGTSIYDFHNPPMTIIGELDERSGDVVAGLYDQLEAPLLRTSLKVAEMVKYSCNAFHALKITFANEIGNLCKRLGIDSHQVMDLFCRDTKLNLSTYYLKPGFAFGGSCLPKDLRALLREARNQDVECPVLDSVLKSNDQQIETAYRMIEKTGKKKIGFVGLSFKPGSDDLRESATVELIEKLIGKGFDVRIYDKEVALARIIGANKEYIEFAIPHVSSLMVDSLSEVIESSEVVVLTKKTDEVAHGLPVDDGETRIVDLVRIWSERQSDDRYDGICW